MIWITIHLVIAIPQSQKSFGLLHLTSELCTGKEVFQHIIWNHGRCFGLGRSQLGKNVCSLNGHHVLFAGDRIQVCQLQCTCFLFLQGEYLARVVFVSKGIPHSELQRQACNGHRVHTLFDTQGRQGLLCSICFSSFMLQWTSSFKLIFKLLVDSFQAFILFLLMACLAFFQDVQQGPDQEPANSLLLDDGLFLNSGPCCMKHLLHVAQNDIELLVLQLLYVTLGKESPKAIRNLASWWKEICHCHCKPCQAEKIGLWELNISNGRPKVFSQRDWLSLGWHKWYQKCHQWEISTPSSIKAHKLPQGFSISCNRACSSFLSYAPKIRFFAKLGQRSSSAGNGCQKLLLRNSFISLVGGVQGFLCQMWQGRPLFLQHGHLENYITCPTV